MRFVILAIVISIGLFPMSAWSQSTQPLAREFEEREKREASREAAKSAEQGLVIEVEPRARVESEEFCIDITAIQVDGITLLPDALVNETLGVYSNSCMGQRGIDTLLQVLSDLYIERGYITSRAYIPEQDLSSGTLTLVVVEGIIEGIAFAQTRNGVLVGSPKERRVRGAVPLKVGEPLELRRLEQGLDQMNRVGSSTVGVDIQPGTTVGGSILVIAADDADMVRGRATYGTNRSDGVQDETLGFSLTADNLLQYNDSFSLSINGGVNSNALSFNSTIPVRHWTFSGGLSYSEQLSQLTATTDLFQGTVTSRLSATYLIARNATQKTNATLSHVKTLERRSINGTSLEDQGNEVLKFDLSQEITMENSFTSFQFSYARGRNRLRDYFKVGTFSGQRYGSLSENWSIYSTVQGQYTGATLSSNQQFFIGGGGLVRGFEAGSIGGDKGLAFTNEFTYQTNFDEACCEGLPDWAKTTLRATQPYLFLDAGAVWLNGGDPAGMVSVGAGLRTSVKGFGVDLGLAIPVSAKGTAQDRGLGIRLQLSRKLF